MKERCNYICGQHLKQCVKERYHTDDWCACKKGYCHEIEDIEKTLKKCPGHKRAVDAYGMNYCLLCDEILEPPTVTVHTK